MLDFAINNGHVYDPAEGRTQDVSVGIKNGRIDTISKHPLTAGEILDADGLDVVPGFIDIHMHEGVLNDGECDLTIAETMLQMGVTTAVGGNCGFSPDSIADYFNYIDQNGYPINLALFFGYNLVRQRLGNSGETAAFRGSDVYTQFSRAELATLERPIRQAMEDGALGLSFGFEYCPGCTTKEAIQAAGYLSDYPNPLLAAHYRKDADGCIDSIKEAVEISEKTNIPFQFSHIGSGAAFGDDSRMCTSLRVLESARRRGVDIMADCYPYTAFSALIGTTVFDDGCLERWQADYGALLVADGPYRNSACTAELFRELRRTAPNTRIIGRVMTEAGVDAALAHPLVMVGSDGKFVNGFGHPRGAGAFPRVLGRYVRERGILSFEQAIDKMTILPAKRLHLFNKGTIREGADADLVVLDRSIISDTATFERPRDTPTGIRAVLVNGRLCVRDQRLIDRTAGVACRHRER